MRRVKVKDRGKYMGCEKVLSVGKKVKVWEGKEGLKLWKG